MIRNGLCLLVMGAGFAGLGCGDAPREQAEVAKKAPAAAPVKDETPRANDLPPPLELPPSLIYADLPSLPAPPPAPASSFGQLATRPITASDLPPPPLILPVSGTEPRPISASDLPPPPPDPK